MYSGFCLDGKSPYLLSHLAHPVSTLPTFLSYCVYQFWEPEVRCYPSLLGGPLSICLFPQSGRQDCFFSPSRGFSQPGAQSKSQWGAQCPGRKEATYPHTWDSTAVAPSQAVSSGGVGIGGGNSSRGRSGRDTGSGLNPKDHYLPSAGILSPNPCHTLLCLKPMLTGLKINSNESCLYCAH